MIKAVVGPAQWGTCIRTIFHVAGTPALAYWNNNIATAGPAGCDIMILDALTGSQTAVLSGHTGNIESLTYSSDGTFLVSGGRDKTIKLWDVQTGGVVKTLCGHTNWVHSVSISADYTTIASGDVDRAICLWNVRTGSCSTIRDCAITVTFSPKNSNLLLLSGDGTVQQGDINGHKIGSPVPGSYPTFSPDGTQFVSLKDKTVIIRNTDSQMTIGEFNLVAPAFCPCFSPNGRLIAVADSDAIYVWDITGPDPCLIQTFTGHRVPINSLVFSSPYTLVSGSPDKSIKFWQISTSSADLVLPDSKSSSTTSAPIKFVSLQARDGLAFSIDSAGVVKTWDILTGCCKQSYKTQIEMIEYADIQLISGSLIIVWKKVLIKGINVWDVEKGKLQTMDIPATHTLGLRITEDGSRVLQLYRNSIRVWNIQTGESLCEEKLKQDDGSLYTFQWGSPEKWPCLDAHRMDGSKVSVSFGESLVQGWDFGTPGSTPTKFSETSLGSPHLKFIDVRKWSKDSPVRVEDGVTEKEVFQLCGKYTNPSAIQWDGQYLIAGYETGEVLIFGFNDGLS